MKKLNLGGGLQKLPGYQNIDRILGTEVYPLRGMEDNSVDEIRASHILEHFPHREIGAVLSDWVRALKPGGWLRVAVPDFDWIVKAYSNGHRDNPMIQSFLFGSQVDESDFHRAMFDAGKLEAMLKGAGLVDIQPWESEISDCASYPVSLNLKGRKPTVAELEAPEILTVTAKTAALFSIPRLGFNDTWGCCFDGLKGPDFDIPAWRFTGAFWDQCIQRGFNAMVKQGIEWLISIDYDTLFTRSDIKELLTLAAMHPEADAICPIQTRRNQDNFLFTMKGADGKLKYSTPIEDFDQDLTPIETGHFGCTLIKLERLKAIPKPWFWSQPNGDGEWDDGRIDADIYFWHKFKASGLRLYQANTVRVGHINMVVSWPDKDFNVLHQYVGDWQKQGKPEACK